MMAADGCDLDTTGLLLIARAYLQAGHPQEDSKKYAVVPLDITSATASANSPLVVRETSNQVVSDIGFIWKYLEWEALVHDIKWQHFHFM